MKKSELLAVVLLLLASVGTIGGIFAIEHYRRSARFTAELTARQPKAGNWYPKRLVVPYGQDIRLLIRNIETVSHGFALPDFNVAANEIKAGEVAVVEFKADKKGTFPFMCTIWCSQEHLQMNGELVVE